ncbi:unnamed protein product [Paramecium sonneborni]|uniref:WD40 repeat-containing protein n=1 Tax=Paramecium sonneborni TaxID=65129 RepID=A0A8S1MHM0_9CILI|nr:unnamed protein product [Paramecium sonneborni]
MINSLKLRSKDLKCPKHNNVITSLCITEKFSMKNRVLCDICLKDKQTYPNWTPLENIEELVQNIRECEKITRTNVIKVIQKLKQDIVQDLEQLEQKIIEIQQKFDHTRLIKKIMNQNQIVISDLQDLSENLSYLTLYSQFKNINKSQLQSEQFQPIFTKLSQIRQQIKCTYEQVLQIEAEVNTVPDYKLLFKSTPVIIPAHDFAINSVVITPDCSKVITASSEGKLKIWDTSTHTEIEQINDNFDYAFCVAISDDGQHIAACGSNDYIIRIWNFNDTKQPIFRLKYHTKTVERIKFVPESSQLVSISQDHQVVIWHETKPEPSRILKHHKSSVKGIAISNNCKFMATSALDKQLIIWNISNNFSIVHQIQPHKTSCNCIEFSKDLKYMVTGGEDGIVKLWKVQTWEPLLEFIGHTSFIWNVQFSNHSNLIISSSTKEIRIWNIPSEQQQQMFSIQQDYYPNFCLSNNHQLLCTGQQNGELFIWKSALN